MNRHDRALAMGKPSIREADRVVLANPGVARFWLRCDSCGWDCYESPGNVATRIYRHFDWYDATPDERVTVTPAKGSYAVKRAPLFLRAVIAADGAMDVLDQITDTPRDGETVHVYKRTGEAGWVHIHFGAGSKRATGFYATGDYEHMPDAPGDRLRDGIGWRAWVRLQVPNVTVDDDGVIQEASR